MNRSLRYCAALTVAQHSATKTSCCLAAQRAFNQLDAELPDLPELSNLHLLQGLRRRLARGLSSYNTFTELQIEVNAVLSSFIARS
eukprot:symbB.v1.2.014069.t1/scaffold1007.1/size144738/14